MKKQTPLFEIVKDNIDEWNPYRLLPDAPGDEFDDESRRITNQINAASSINEIAKAVSDIFSSAFGQKGFSVDLCHDVALKIRDAIDKYQ